jgi:hypothetical protein
MWIWRGLSLDTNLNPYVALDLHRRIEIVNSTFFGFTRFLFSHVIVVT